MSVNVFFKIQKHSIYLPTIKERQRLYELFNSKILEKGDIAYKEYVVVRCGYMFVPESNNDLLVALKMGMGFKPALKSDFEKSLPF